LRQVAAGHRADTLGTVTREKGDPGRAIPLLEESVRELARFGFRQFHGLFTAMLGEAERNAGRLEKALAPRSEIQCAGWFN